MFLFEYKNIILVMRVRKSRDVILKEIYRDRDLEEILIMEEE